MLPDLYYQLLKSCLTERKICIKHEDAYSELKNVRAGVRQRRILGLVLYLFFTKDVTKTITTFAENIALLTVGNF